MERLTEKQKHILRKKLCDMKRRCYNPKSEFYKDYGGRGITICQEWIDKKYGHVNFQKWAIESGWKEFLSIDRINVNGNYEPSNCRWATSKEQAANRRTTIYTTINGVTKSTREWSEQIGITERAFLSRLEYGWDETRLLEPKYKPLKMTKAEMSKEIRDWRKLEEQGLLIRLPCKPETKLYWLSDEGYGYEPIEEIEVVDFLYNGYSIQMYFADKGEKDFLPLPVEAIGDELFFTKKEAEAVLAEMGDAKC